MAKKVYEEENISNIAIAIREKTGGDKTYKTSEMVDGVREVYEAGQIKTLADAECLNGKLQGTTVKANDVANIEHNVPCRLESKNLVNADLFPNFTKQEDGSYLSNTTIYTAEKIEINLPSAIYTLSYSIKSPVNKNYKFEIYYNDGTTGTAFYPSTGDYKSITFTTNGKSIKYIGFYYSDLSNEVQFKDLQLELGSTATPYTPYITDFSQVEVSRYGKNLLDYTKATDRRNNPLTIIENGVLWDKTIDYYFFVPCFIPKGFTFVLTCKSDFEENPDIIDSFNAILEDGTSFYSSIGKAYTFSENVVSLRIRKKNASTTETTPIKVTNLQVELGDTATDYEPYKEPTTYQSTAEGVVNGITSIAPSMTLLTNAEGVIINANYYKDPDIVISNLQQAVAMSGGE